MSGQNKQHKPNNLRLALILGSIALVFFLAVIVKRIWLS
ncbi:cytochrome oxidase small assembly protein [Pseudoduganella chitinolytica]|uniref:Cytochrome oxidase small assembly protein n=1 Tax=Pseudoduganella chitinolytica TaxID=34070 RepID=A0ABY8B4W5_9BURK|nr:cytochrome oxidase small assembly protein [Pseudoduganella chitinolytica]WEF30991.1 cytochrome oxidase small assembly protein [Pseudoduganella chitinolytica]